MSCQHARGLVMPPALCFPYSTAPNWRMRKYSTDEASVVSVEGLSESAIWAWRGVCYGRGPRNYYPQFLHRHRAFSSCVCLTDLQCVDGPGALAGAPGAAGE